MSSDKFFEYQIPSTKKIKLPALTEPRKDKQINFSGKLHIRHETGEQSIVVGNDRHRKWPSVEICKWTENKEVFKFLESFINFEGVSEKVL